VKVRVILLEPESAGNIGSVARSMKNFGQNDLWIINPKTPVDTQAVALAMHGIDVLTSAKIVNHLHDALSGIDTVVGTSSIIAKSSTNIARTSITPRELVFALSAVRGSIALVFGRESSGLTNQEIENCDLLVTIPASRAYNVLNLSTAVSIILYEIFQQEQRVIVRPLATNAAREKLLEQFELLVNRSGTRNHKRRLAVRAFRNVASRSFLSIRETSLLVGVFRKAASKIR